MEKQIWGILWFYLEEEEEQEQRESPFIRTDERTARGKPNSEDGEIRETQWFIRII